MKLKKIEYTKLNSRQQESYNFQKVAAKLADYGFNALRLTDDWQGADFIASHIDGSTFLKVQLKGRVGFYKKYLNKDIWICFRDNDSGEVYLYPHDIFAEEIATIAPYQNNKSWKIAGSSHWIRPTRKILKLLEKYKI